MQKVLTKAEFHYTISDGRRYKVVWDTLDIGHQTGKKFAVVVLRYAGEGDKWSMCKEPDFVNFLPTWPTASRFLNDTIF